MVLKCLKNIPDVVLNPTSKSAKGYGDHNIEFLGTVNLYFEFRKHKFRHTFYVIDGNQVNLLGRDALSKLNMSIDMPVNNINKSCGNILGKYKHYLSENFKSCVKEKVSLHVDPSHKPVYCKARSIPVRYKQLVYDELQRLEKHGVISRVYNSRYASPIVVVLKDNGQIRLCSDFSGTINRHINVPKYPLPNIDDIIANMGQTKVFSKIDCYQAYSQIPLDEQSKEFTSIITPFGVFCHNYLPYGASSCPSVFQAYICKILSGIPNTVAFQDDILIMGSDKDHHDHILDQVLNALMTAGIKINIKKSKFYVDEVRYLGYVFNHKGVQPCPDKLDAILKAPAPASLKQVQSFIGMCTFYSKFFPNFSTVFSPLYQLLKKNVKFVWGIEQEKCFQLIKDVFRSGKILQNFDPGLETALEVDASQIGVGAAILQKHGNQWLPVKFASRSLNSAERNYSQIEREGLAVIFGCEKFRNFLLGTKFILKNDHKPLAKLFSNCNGVPVHCSPRLIRWALRLSQFNFTFQYTKGSEMLNSDFLSRHPLKETSDVNEPYEVIFTISHMDNSPVTCRDIARATDADSTLCKLKDYIKNGFPHSLDHELAKFKSFADELSISKNCIMFQDRVFIPKSLRKKVLEFLHTGHPGIVAFKSIARGLIWYVGMDADIVDVVKTCQTCQNSQNNPPQNSTIEWPRPKRKFSRLHIDHFFFENHTFLVVIDALTKYLECEIVSGTTARETINVLRRVFAANGLPDCIVSDNAKSFMNEEFKQFLGENYIDHLTGAPRCPYTNGQGERAVRVLKDLLKKNTVGSLNTRLCNVLLYYRNTPHSVTKIAPSVALNNRRYVTLRERINPNYVPDIKSKEITNIRSFEVGNDVLVRDLRPGQKWLKGVITEKLGENMYKVYVIELNTIWRRHVQQLLSHVPYSSSPNLILPASNTAISGQPQGFNNPLTQTPAVSGTASCQPQPVTNPLTKTPGVSGTSSNDIVPQAEKNSIGSSDNSPVSFYDLIQTPENSVTDVIDPNLMDENIPQNVDSNLRRSSRIRKAPSRYSP